MIDLMLWAAWVVVGGGGILGGVWVAVRVGSLVARVFFRATTPSPSSSDLPTLETMKGRAARDARRNYSTDSDGWSYSVREVNQKVLRGEL